MGKTSTARTIAGVLVGVVGMGGAAALMLTSKRTPAAAAGKPAPAAAGVPLTTAGTVNVGMVSSIPQSVGFDTGPIDYSTNKPGWDYAPLGIGGTYGR